MIEVKNERNHYLEQFKSYPSSLCNREQKAITKISAITHEFANLILFCKKIMKINFISLSTDFIKCCNPDLWCHVYIQAITMQCKKQYIIYLTNSFAIMPPSYYTYLECSLLFTISHRSIYKTNKKRRPVMQRRKHIHPDLSNFKTNHCTTKYL